MPSEVKFTLPCSILRVRMSIFLRRGFNSSKRTSSSSPTGENRTHFRQDDHGYIDYFFFVIDHKKGDQASIIGGAIEFIKELHQVLQSLEAKKRRKSVSPCPTPSPRPLLPLTPSPTSNNTYEWDIVKELGACCNSPVADVEAKISGSNVLLRTLSKRIPGQVIKIITVLEKLAFEILHLNISSMEDTVLYSFVIKIGFDCQLSVEELALEVQQTFYQDITC